jgi:hypothetical protein
MLVLFLLMVSAAAEGGVGAAIGGTIFAAIFSVVAGGVAIVPAVTLLTIPTMFVGGSLCLLARSRAWLGRASTFIIAGALLGAAAYVRLVPTGRLAAFEDPRPLAVSHPSPIMIFLIAGACSALVFRSTMGVIGSFFGEHLDEPEQPAHDGTLP